MDDAGYKLPRKRRKAERHLSLSAHYDERAGLLLEVNEGALFRRDICENPTHLAFSLKILILPLIVFV